MIRVRVLRYLLSVACLSAAGFSCVASAQGRLELIIHTQTEKNLAIGLSDVRVADANAESVFGESDISASVAGSVVVDVTIGGSKAVLINITGDNTAVGGSVAGSVVMTDAGITPIHESTRTTEEP